MQWSEAAGRAEVVRLLTYANKTAVAGALGVSPQAVLNWAAGLNISEKRWRQIRELYGLDAENSAPGEPETELAAIRKAVESTAVQLSALRSVLESMRAQLPPPPDDQEGGRGLLHTDDRHGR